MTVMSVSVATAMKVVTKTTLAQGKLTPEITKQPHGFGVVLDRFRGSVGERGGGAGGLRGGRWVGGALNWG